MSTTHDCCGQVLCACADETSGRAALVVEPGSEQAVRAQILALVREYYRLRHAPVEPFEPGKTPVRIGGRIFDEEELVNLVGASLDFWLTEGPECVKFTREFSRLQKVPYAVLTNSGSSANLLAFSALLSPNLGEERLRPGDEVIGVSAAFPTTVNPILQTGCVPVFVDITLGTYNIDVRQLEAARSPRTRAVFLAHTLGNPFDLDAVMAFATRHRLFVIEDTCDALGSTYRGQPVGTFGTMGTYSFYPPHHMTMGEGGAVTMRDPRLFRAVTALRNWGRDCWCLPGVDNTCGKRFAWQVGRLPEGYDHKYIITHIGYNLKLLDLQAAIGLAQLAKLPAFEAARRRNFAWLSAQFKRFEEFFHLPYATEGSDPSWFGFPLTVRETAPFTRGELVTFLEERKIMTRMMFAGHILDQPAYQQIAHRAIGPLPNTRAAAERAFWIGCYGGVTEAMLRYIMDTFGEFLKRW